MVRTLVAAGLTGAALLLAITAWRPRKAARTRLPRIAAATPGAETAGRSAKLPRPGRLPRWADRIRLGAVLTGLVAAVLVSGWLGAGLGLLTAIGLDRALRRLEPADVRRTRLREAADLPLAADLLAAALRAGAPVERAVEAVAEALGGSLGDRLDRVARMLRLGGEPREAWAYLTPVPGGDRLVASAVRSSASGAAMAGALNRLADDLRADRATRAEAAARRAGVLIVLPLGLCFLPAFILAGLVPVIVAVLGDVW